MESPAPDSAQPALPLVAPPPTPAPVVAAPSPAPEIVPEVRPWSLAALQGRLGELVSQGHTPLLSASMALVRQAQRDGQPVAWIAATSSLFYPPDVAEGGIDLTALPVVRTKDLRQGLRAADTLLRSGSFGLVVLDAGNAPSITVPVQARLAGLARKHAATLLVLRRHRERQAEQGGLVSFRVRGILERERAHRFRLRLSPTKDKSNGSGWSHEEICRGPDGLC